MNKNPALTIITALLSFDESIVETFESFKKDLASNAIRWIIKCSEKPTEEQLLLFKDYKDQIILFSQKDNSLYEALNQALSLVKTDFFLVLGSGDILLSEAITLINNKIKENPEADGFLFTVNYQDYIYPPALDSIHFRMPSSHQGAVLKTENAISIGSFDLKYNYASDYDLLCRYYLAYSNLVCSNYIIGTNKPGGLSEKNRFETVLELYLIGHKFWKNKYKEFEFNEIILNNLTFVQKYLKQKKIKKMKEESMQSPSQLREEIFSHLLKIENERSNKENERYQKLTTEISKLYSAISELSEAISIANEEFENLKSKITQPSQNDNFSKQDVLNSSSFFQKKTNNYIKYSELSENESKESAQSKKLKDFFGI